jgi:hypothetical protein
VLFHQSFHGASFASVPSGLRIVEYLQLVLQSDLARHYALQADPHLGVERDQVHLETMKCFPVVPYARLSSTEQAAAHELAVALGKRLDPALATRINSFVARLYHLTDIQQQTIRDTVTTALPTKEALTTALSRTTVRQRREFVTTCEHSLRVVLSASDLTAHVELRDDLSDDPWRFAQIDRVPLDEPPKEPVELPMAEFLRAADQGAASRVTLRVDGATTLVGLLDRYRYWTRTRARLLASTLLAGGED